MQNIYNMYTLLLRKQLNWSFGCWIFSLWWSIDGIVLFLNYGWVVVSLSHSPFPFWIFWPCAMPKYTLKVSTRCRIIYINTYSFMFYFFKIKAYVKTNIMKVFMVFTHFPTTVHCKLITFLRIMGVRFSISK